MNAESCVVLAGGTGTRLRAVTGGGNKHLVPINGVSALRHVIEPVVASATVGSVVVVTSPEWRDVIAHELRGISRPVHVVTQPRADGTLAAVLCALPMVTADRLCVHLGDNLFGWRQLPPAPPWYPVQADAVLYVVRGGASEARHFGRVVVEHSAGWLVAVSLAEKEDAPPGHDGALLLTGFVRVTRAALSEAAAAVRCSVRGEWELTSALDYLARRGRAGVELVEAPWLDIGTPERLTRAPAVLAARRTSTARPVRPTAPTPVRSDGRARGLELPPGPPWPAPRA